MNIWHDDFSSENTIKMVKNRERNFTKTLRTWRADYSGSAKKWQVTYCSVKRNEIRRKWPAENETEVWKSWAESTRDIQKNVKFNADVEWSNT